MKSQMFHKSTYNGTRLKEQVLLGQSIYSINIHTEEISIPLVPYLSMSRTDSSVYQCNP